MGPLTYQVIRPSAALARHVQCYWVLEGGGGVAPHLVLPDGFVEIVFRQGEGGLALGQMCRPRSELSPAAFRWIGVRLRPESAHRFFRTAQTEMSDRITPLEDLWGPAARELAEAEAPQIEWALYRHLRPSAPLPGIDRAVNLILGSGGTVSMHRLARAVAMSGRNLERSFRERVGVPPKTLARVVRFQRALWALEGRDSDPPRRPYELGAQARPAFGPSPAAPGQTAYAAYRMTCSSAARSTVARIRSTRPSTASSIKY
jgi:AraC-like DNA-binding protein